jgi:hypothetical protein
MELGFPMIYIAKMLLNNFLMRIKSFRNSQMIYRLSIFNFTQSSNMMKRKMLALHSIKRSLKKECCKGLSIAVITLIALTALMYHQ